MQSLSLVLAFPGISKAYTRIAFPNFVNSAKSRIISDYTDFFLLGLGNRLPIDPVCFQEREIQFMVLPYTEFFPGTDSIK